MEKINDLSNAKCILICLVAALWCVDKGQCYYGSPSIQFLRQGGLTCQDKQIIIDEHNKLRQKIALGQIQGQPGAANMLEMIWDDELAARAQKWAELCTDQHDPSRQYARFFVGQNIGKSWTTARPASIYDVQPDFPSRIASWFNEVHNYQRGRENVGTGHFTQVIWSNTWAVGCGYTMYYDPSRGFTKNYVCNYGPAGNLRGSQPYQIGVPACGRYGMSSSNHYRGLCVNTGYHPLGAYCAPYGR